MTLADFVVSRSIKTITRTICRVEKDWIGQVPLQGPLIIVANHINFLDVPLMYSHLYPRPMTGFAKIETWDNPLMGMLFNLMGQIPSSAVRQTVPRLREVCRLYRKVRSWLSVRKALAATMGD